MNLKERTHKFVDELGITITKFAVNAGIGHSTLYKWWSGEIELSEEMERRLDEYLAKYGF